ncbi:MAG: hypothetical protein IPL03_14635 [Sterolibacteriaceae bacterium]|nr:hypothetical protein [Candidatus Methylophosphatis haderslevensis]
MSRHATIGQRHFQFCGCGKCRRDAGYDLKRHPSSPERVDFFLSTPEQHRIAALEANDNRIVVRRFDQLLVDFRLVM